MSTLRREAEGIWTAEAPQRFYGLHFGTRMTVLRLPDGGLWIHSPVSIDVALKGAIDALGPVRHLVAPSLFHHLYAGEAIRLWPTARLHAPAALRRKRPDLRIDSELSEEPDPGWQDALLAIRLEGAPMIRETLFLHPATRTLISSDLVENFDTSPHWPTRIYLGLAGLRGRVGWSRFFRPVYRDRRAARRSVDRLLGHDFDRIILAHGRVLESGGREAVRQAYRWLDGS